ncbi:histone-lysine N-methyltransferase SETD5 isoform X3 [Denticeps clupeoides]|uniref:histone-lysine N-methyltransferase SETD5 isoform X3 n=1 Tax=Denticeps clupeoides TaxID=299321 RepID=UPI0010A2EA0A|nr:histone-lysine N-methyltransferase SETD5 isoform X3 [Denticeps clupeoides]
MSIAIAVGVTTPETSNTDMAAGSDPESVEASPAVNEKSYPNQSCGKAQNHGYRGLPYASSVVCCQDHNYGAPPPPTPPASPLSQTIIPRMELNGVARSHYHDDPDDSADTESSSEEEEGSVPSWCHCTVTQDGFVIKCENCRVLDRRKVLDTPHRKPENVSVGESSATESGDEEVSPSTVSYTATQHTPTSITLTVNRVKRPKAKKRKKSTEKTRAAPKAKKIKAFREGSRKSMRMKNSTMEASVLDENTAEGWEMRIRQWTDQYEEALSNQYSADVQKLLQLHQPPGKSSSPTPDTINRTELACNNTVLGSQMQLQVGRVTRVQKHRKILRAARDLEPDTLIIEYRGKVMLKQQFEVNGHFFKKPYPFVLFYSKFNEVDMCVDARTFGNDARFIRRSCTPNAEVRHMISEGMIHLCIYAVTQISKDSEVTIGFDYEFNSCNYKVDCACHKGNQNCPVQKHNLNPRDSLLPPVPTVPTPPGAETRRRRARRRELEGGGGSEDSNQQAEEPVDGRDTHAGSDQESREDRKPEPIVQLFETLDRRKKRISQGAQGGTDELKQDSVEQEEGEVLTPAGANLTPGTGAVGGVSTRRTSYALEPPVETDSKPPAVLAAPKPPPARSTKPRPKSRMSRYRSGSAQRARRQRQALAQQAAEQAAAVAEEGAAGSLQGDQGQGDGASGVGQFLEGDGLGGAGAGALGNKANPRYLKTKKYLVTEWLNDKVPEKPENEVERPLRITTDPTVLATTLNMLPGLTHSSLICTNPKQYIRFGSPFNPERRRRPITVDGSYGSYKKRWIKQAQDETLSSASQKDETESNSSHQSGSSCSTLHPFKTVELTAPFKKRKSKYAPELTNPTSDLLLRPLSPITPPLPTDPITSRHPLLYLGEEDGQNGAGLHYSPLTSLPASRCNTPLQFENISSPEASPVHRAESLSPEPCLRPDFDAVRTATFPDLSMTSSLGSPAPTSEDFLMVSPSPLGVSAAGMPVSVPSAGDSSLGTRPVEPPAREQAFRTEFNLIYTCSPLNANLGDGLSNRAPLTDRRLSQSEGSFSPAESYFSGQGLLSEAGSGSLSPCPEPHYGGGYPESSTPPHPSNPPQKRKRVNVAIVSQLAVMPGSQALAVRGQYKPIQNTVSLLEYRKRKQGVREMDCGGTPTRPSSLVSSAESPCGPRALLQPPASPHCSFSSPAHQTFAHVEEVSPPDPSANPRMQDSTHWMVPTSVERLREGQGVLERVLRGSVKMERTFKRSEGTVNDHSNSRDKDEYVDGDRYDLTTASPMRSPHRYSPSVFSHQVPNHLSDSHPASENSASPFRSSYSPAPSAYPRLSSHVPLSQDQAPQQTHHPTASSSSCSAADSRQPGGAGHQQSNSASTDASHLYSSSHLKTSLSASPKPSSRGQALPKTDSAHVTTGSQPAHSSRLVSQQAMGRSLKPASPGQSGLQTNSRLLSASSSQHYSQRPAPLSQFQQGSGVRTQSGSF